MIDLSALGLSSVQTSNNGGKRDKADTSHEHGKGAKSFGDFVNQAGKKSSGRHAADEDAAVLKADDLEVDARKGDGKQISDAAATHKLGAGNVADATSVPNVEENYASHNAASKAGAKNTAAAASAKKSDDRDDVNDTATSKTGSRSAIDAVAMLKVDGKKAGNDDTAAAKIGKSGNVAATDTVVPEDEEAIDIDLLTADPANSETAGSEGRVQISAGLRQLMKSGAMGGVLHRADDGKDEVKGGKVENKQMQNFHEDDAPAVKDKTGASPSEELHALLGMTPAKDDPDANADAVERPTGKPSRNSVHAGDDDQAVDAKAARAEHVDDAGAGLIKADVPAAQAAAAQHAAQKFPDNAALQTDADDGKALADQDVGKLVSPDSKGRPVDIELKRPEGDRHADPAAGGKTDFVTVLDSRRYLGFTTDSSNTAVLANAIKAEPSWAQVIQNVKTGAGLTATEVNTLKLQMNPEHLGNMTASLRLKGDELSVEVRVETVDAYRQLSKDQDGIVKALKDQGFSIDQVSIQLSQAARSDAGQGSGQNNGNQSQTGSSGQNLQQGGQGDNARQRDESARRSPNQNNWIGNDSTSTLSDSGTGRSSADAGNLYL